MVDRITFMGIHGSPYTRKMMALLRYRHLPYRFIGPDTAKAEGRPEPRIPFFPTFYLPDEDRVDRAVTDSTPIIRLLDTLHQDRSVLPTDPALALINDVLEDYGDEWLTKAMFHYRWVREADIDRGGTIIPMWMNLTQPDQVLAAAGRSFAERQIGRLGYVGSNEITGPVIEESYRRLILALNAHLRDWPFLLGTRPASADFAIYGQLTQLAQFDPTPMALTLEIAPRVFAWVDRIDDLTGLDPAEDGWGAPETLPETLIAILREAGRTYAPVMVANAMAVLSGSDSVEAMVDGQTWTQRPFSYQAKCLGKLRDTHAALSTTDRTRFDAAISATGCEALFQPTG
ncbi:MAG: glutathione S-transferase family protein [Pseudomonadota bacterium]